MSFSNSNFDVSNQRKESYFKFLEYIYIRKYTKDLIKINTYYKIIIIQRTKIKFMSINLYLIVSTNKIKYTPCR